MGDLLLNLTKRKMDEEHLSLRRASDQIGISHMALKRFVSKDGGVGIDKIILISNWVGIEPAVALELRRDEIDSISTVLRRYPELTEVFSDLLKQVECGALDPRIIEDLASYTKFKINNMKK